MKKTIGFALGRSFNSLSSKTKKRAYGAAGLGAATSLAASLVTVCCAGPVGLILGPLLVVTLGASGAAALAGLRSYAPYLFGASFISLVIGFWITYRRRGSCETGMQRRWAGLERYMLFFAAAIFTLSLAYALAYTHHL